MISRTGFKATLVALALATAVAPVRAEAPSPRAALAIPPQVPLTDAIVEQFLASWPLMQGLAADLSAKDGGVLDPMVPGKAFLAWSADPDAKDRIEEVLAESGFDDLKQWAAVSDTIMATHMFDANDTKTHLDEALEVVKNDPSLDPDQKAKLIAAMEHAAGTLARYKPSPENQAIVDRHADRIDATVLAD